MMTHLAPTFPLERDYVPLFSMDYPEVESVSADAVVGFDERSGCVVFLVTTKKGLLTPLLPDIPHLMSVLLMVE